MFFGRPLDPLGGKDGVVVEVGLRRGRLRHSANDAVHDLEVSGGRAKGLAHRRRAEHPRRFDPPVGVGGRYVRIALAEVAGAEAHGDGHLHAGHTGAGLVAHDEGDRERSPRLRFGARRL